MNFAGPTEYARGDLDRVEQPDEPFEDIWFVIDKEDLNG
ncbi:Uncharacterized protein pbN1_42010 [Aromatoleum bremense]|nr:Uncharacterized protein pbN1_42010 [Aromatoleum bremense]